MFKEEKLKNKIKTEKTKITETKTNSQCKNKGITLISLVITIVILLILAGVAISMAVDSNGLFARARQAANEWNESVAEEQQTIQDLMSMADEITAKRKPISQFYQNGGSIEVKFVDKDNQIIKEPLSPVLGADMTPVKWNGTAWENTNADDAEWYNYSQSKWANAKTEDGSMWVWIPRYAYEITYTLAPYTEYAETPLEYTVPPDNPVIITAEEFKSIVNLETGEIYYNSGYSNIYPASELEQARQNGLISFYTYEELADGNYAILAYDAYYSTLSGTKTIVGYSNSRGIVTTSGEIALSLEPGVETSGKYIVHPAFTTDLSLGGWSEDLAGIWVAKYEMSMETDGSHTETNSTTGNVLTTDTIKMVSKPGVSSWRYITIGNAYTNCYYYNRANESHLMKNSEWGAVAYLSYSQYGTNGGIISRNNSEITGAGGATSSSTGNETGIYDLNSKTREYVATYNKNATLTGGLDNDGSNFATGENTKYATAYENETSIITGKTLVAKVCKTGDGRKEMYSSAINSCVESTGYSWNRNYSASILQFGICDHFNRGRYFL